MFRHEEFKQILPESRVVSSLTEILPLFSNLGREKNEP